MRGQPDLYGFVNNDSGVADRKPNHYFFDGQLVPRADENSHHGTILEPPPLVWQRQCSFPDQANENDYKKSKTECAPVDKRSHCSV